MWAEPRIQIIVANILLTVSVGIIAFSMALRIPGWSIFAIRDVRISGDLQHLKQNELQQVIAQGLRGNLITLDIDRLRDAFSRLPWVATVSVTRAWPEAVNIKLGEHIAFARWGKNALLDDKGEIFSGQSNDALLPKFDGPADSSVIMLEHDQVYTRLLAPLGLKVKELSLSQRMSWTIRLNNGLLLKLGQQADEQRLKRFVDVYPETLARLAVMPTYVDLRYSNGFAMHLPSKAKKQASTDQALLEKKNG
ncbi:MAG: cell division protein FtsQ/DivIB [Proteobacteria bacterium]|nr:cell division protein FtsQ/DivIB [Pseudomonadota bacterium]MDE3207229.1 cell division protein FtsQ/DivIB [Pseudomonadota bacterium]